jgi:hypothetical protein
MQLTQGAWEPHAVGVLITHAPASLEQQKFIMQPPPSQSAEHTPPMHEEAAPVQVTQAWPLLPHAEGVPPPTHVPASSQQPPLQVIPGAQLFEHLPVAALHASPFGQSAGPVQP